MLVKKTVVFGASPNPARYSYVATMRLVEAGREVVPVGIREGMIGELPIVLGHPEVEEVDTITMYVGAKRQVEHLDYLLGLNPRRIIFNPGAENPELADRARELGIEVLEACTLVLLSTQTY